jgi:transcriptional regulator with XRE-family HTH domain
VVSHFRANLTYIIQERFGASYKDKVLADALGVDRSTVNRIRGSDTLPSRDRLEALSRYFQVTPEMWLLQRDEFVMEHQKLTRPQENARKSRAVGVSMHAIEAHRHLWRDSFNIHKGQYIAYWKASGQKDYYVASIIEITRLGPSGLEFELINPYIRDDIDQDEVRIWKYAGFTYPVADYLYFYGEQSEGTYELFSMIMTASPIAPPDILRGCLSGIHVKDGRRQIAVNISVVLMFVKKPLADWRREIGERLGKLPVGKVPERIRKLIDPYPGVIPLG